MLSKLLVAAALATSAAIAVAAALWVVGPSTSTEARAHAQPPAAPSRCASQPRASAPRCRPARSGLRRQFVSKKKVVVCVGYGRSIGILVRRRTALRPRVARTVAVLQQPEMLETVNELPASTAAMIPGGVEDVLADRLRQRREYTCYDWDSDSEFGDSDSECGENFGSDCDGKSNAVCPATVSQHAYKQKDSEALAEELYEMFAATDSEEQQRAAFAAHARQLSVHFRFDCSDSSHKGCFDQDAGPGARSPPASPKPSDLEITLAKMTKYLDLETEPETESDSDWE
ncbi:hypothetical protein PHYSODRAFT_325986 [Phytophthora sojae]|uniref:Uncharacterized protein n=1 Tax=Phytophthora sojae (strain P6497) TaxID=1094619 RepID=G4YVC4_PHYSP|nr:hypothetical protein PHYSODRAFT_325986 [Phytophthora sojae]EGZ24930.1 hypothetical protein PHYSODRAFT_325986 [Phytophthora sojae]|eukprot:XP_009520218.1 hypothetical protein PHYSODRAFT_325986 [Phytophthora sojae]